MARLEFPAGFEGSENLPRTKRTVQNMWNNLEGRMIARPGIQLISTTAGGVARGSFEWNGSLYVVVSQELRKITNLETGASSLIGTIAGPEPIESAVGFNDAVIIVKGGASYTLSKTDTLTDTSGEDNFEPFIDVAHLNDRFIYVPSSGLTVKFSDVGAAGTIGGLSFFNPQVLPDISNGVFTFRNDLYICGTDSIEIFRDTGASPNPFVRLEGGGIQNGLIGGILEYNNTFLFLGREKGQDFGIYGLNGGEAPKVSNERIDLILSTYTLLELSEVIPGRFKWRGYDIATFTLRRDSFGFFRGNWFLLDTVIEGISRPWSAGFITQFQGEYFTAFSDRFGKFANINTDYGEPITRRLGTAIEQPDTDYFRLQSIELGISQGFDVDQGTLALFLSEDNVIFSEPIYQVLGEIGEYDKKLIWNYAGGLGNYRGFLAFEFYTREDIVASDDYIVLEID